MTLDQKIQLWNVVGTWFAAIATFSAVLVSLWLATHSKKVRLNLSLKVGIVFIGDGSPGQKYVTFSVANVGERPVTISSINWQVGKKKDMRFAYQPIDEGQIPKQINYGDSAIFTISLTRMPHWPKDFAAGFVEDLSDENIKTLKAIIVTSIGERFEITPDTSIVKLLRESVM